MKLGGGRRFAIGVAGAGVMGCPVAAELARAGYHVILCDINASARSAALSNIRNSLRMRVLLRGEELVEPIEKALSRITITHSLEDFSVCPIVIENIVENLEAKEVLYRAMREFTLQATAVVVNSSTLEIAKAGAWLGRPECVVGVHFMNPVAAIDAVEVITCKLTGLDAIREVEAMLSAIGKRALMVRDSCGYVSNRVYMLTVNEAIRALEEGVAPADTIDQIFQYCFGWKTGPLATADIIGLDTIKLSLEALKTGFEEEKFAPAGLLNEMVESGRLGCKSGGGFYDYS